MRVVADTNIIVSGVLWRGSPRRVLDAARDGIIEICTSPAILAELERVLGREKFLRRLECAGVTVRELADGYSALASAAVDTEPIYPVVSRDPDDDAVLACALSAEAEIIVSGDADLLALETYRGIRILTAGALLTELSL